MLDKVALWQRIEPVVRSRGFRLFDMDLPGRHGGVLRLYISAAEKGSADEKSFADQASQTAGLDEASEGQHLEDSAEELAGDPEGALREGSVSVDNCAEVSRAILRMPDVEELLPGNTLLEVSSPGINRRLSLRDHFEGAISERVKVTYETEERGSRTVRGVLESVRAVGEEKPDAGSSGSDATGSDATGVYRRLYGSRSGWQVVVKVDDSGEQLVVPGNKISKARVDFDFT